MKACNTQNWTFYKVACYLVYRFIGKYLPHQDKLGILGAVSHKFRSRICRPLFKDSAKIIGVGNGVDFGNGCSIVMKECANLGSYVLIQGTMVY